MYSVLQLAQSWPYSLSFHSPTTPVVGTVSVFYGNPMINHPLMPLPPNQSGTHLNKNWDKHIIWKHETPTSTQNAIVHSTAKSNGQKSPNHDDMPTTLLQVIDLLPTQTLTTHTATTIFVPPSCICINALSTSNQEWGTKTCGNPHIIWSHWESTW